MNRIPEDCKKRVLELEEKLHELEEENAYLRQLDGHGRTFDTALHSRADSWDVSRADSISTCELRRQLDEMFHNYEALAKEFEDYRGKQDVSVFSLLEGSCQLSTLALIWFPLLYL